MIFIIGRNLFVAMPTGASFTVPFLPFGGAAAADDLALATRTWGYLARELRGPDGLYADNRADDGTVDPAIYSYNQGTPVGLAVLLAFIGVKLLLHALHENELPFINGGEHVSVPEIPIAVSLGAIVVILGVTTIDSLWKSKRDARLEA